MQRIIRIKLSGRQILVVRDEHAVTVTPSPSYSLPNMGCSMGIV
jgi:hypothetical protein